MKKRQLKILSTVLVLALISGCAAAPAQSTPKEEETQEAPVLEKIPEEAPEEETEEEVTQEEPEEISEDKTDTEAESASKVHHDPWEGLVENIDDTETEILEGAVVFQDGDLILDSENLPEDIEDPGEEAIKVDTEAGGVGQIVIFGDSQFGNFKNPSGADAWIECYTGGKVYDLAVGGTTAAMVDANPDDDPENWHSRSLLGMVYAVCGRISPDYLKDYDGGDDEYAIFKSCDFSKTDYFIIEYGVNDFMNKVKMSALYDPRTFIGSLRRACWLLGDTYPDAKIVLVGPNYAQFFSASTGEYLGDGNNLHNGEAFLWEYSNQEKALAEEVGAIWVDSYNWMRIGPTNGHEYLLDGIHLNNPARRRFAMLISRFIARDAGYYDFGQALVEAPEIDFDQLDQELLSIDWSKDPK